MLAAWTLRRSVGRKGVLQFIPGIAVAEAAPAPVIDPDGPRATGMPESLLLRTLQTEPAWPWRVRLSGMVTNARQGADASSYPDYFVKRPVRRRLRLLLEP